MATLGQQQRILVRCLRAAGVLFTLSVVLGVAATQAAQAQTFTVLHRFRGFPSDGRGPQARLLKDTAGSLYGTTTWGGTYGGGTVFKLDSADKETVLFNFFRAAVNDYGYQPTAGLIEDASSNLYGTTSAGGIESCPDGIPQEGGCGTVFKLDTTRKMTALHRFQGPFAGIGNGDGAFPSAGLISDASGNLYGTTANGGTGGCNRDDCGTVFKLDKAGKETILYKFGFFGSGIDGDTPMGDLIFDASGNLYGTTADTALAGQNGLGGCGTVFKVDSSGNETILYNFNAGGTCFYAGPRDGVVRDSNGNLYGTTTYYGDPVCQCGTAFKLDSGGNLTVVHSFTGGTDGAFPRGLLRDAAGNLFGATLQGGGSITCSGGCGTVFKLDPSGTETILHRFTGGSDGRFPNSLIRDAAGNLYGTTFEGGAFPPFCGPANSPNPGCGVVFKITP